LFREEAMRQLALLLSLAPKQQVLLPMAQQMRSLELRLQYLLCEFFRQYLFP
jgi:hypothetical protein